MSSEKIKIVYHSDKIEKLRYIDGKSDWIDLKATREFIDSLNAINPGVVERVEVLPYHTMAIAKYEKLGIPYRLEGVPMPTKEQVEFAKSILCK